MSSSNNNNKKSQNTRVTMLRVEQKLMIIHHLARITLRSYKGEINHNKHRTKRIPNQELKHRNDHILRDFSC